MHRRLLQLVPLYSHNPFLYYLNHLIEILILAHILASRLSEGVLMIVIAIMYAHSARTDSTVDIKLSSLTARATFLSITA
jgi:hypothetical protein